MDDQRPPVPVTVFTGSLGSGKTSLILTCLRHSSSPTDRIHLLKNEYGDLAIDSQLLQSAVPLRIQEVPNGCLCCMLVGRLEEGVRSVLTAEERVDRLIIETGGSTHPTSLALQLSQLERQYHGRMYVDGVYTVVDCEQYFHVRPESVGGGVGEFLNRQQARYTNLLLLNKHHSLDEREMDRLIDALGEEYPGVEYVYVDPQENGWCAVVWGVNGRKLTGTSALAAEAEPHVSTPPSTPHAHPQSFQFQILIDDLQAPLASISDLQARLETFSQLVRQESWSIYRLKAFYHLNDDRTTIINWAFGKYSLHGIPQSSMRNDTESLLHGNVIGMHLLLNEQPSLRVRALLERAFRVQRVHLDHPHPHQH